MAINPQVGEHTFDENSGFARRQAFDEKQRVIHVIDIASPFVEIARSAVPCRRHQKQIAFDFFIGEQHGDILLTQLEIERRVTEMLVLRHELEMFLDDVTEQIGATAGEEVGNQYRELMEQICGHEHDGKQRSSLQKLTERLSCNLAKAEWESLLTDLRGKHLHVWRDDDDSYSILFASQTPKVVKALQKLAAGESGCEAHLEPVIEEADGGTLFRARGDNAFLFAQLFLALEAGEA